MVSKYSKVGLIILSFVLVTTFYALYVNHTNIKDEKFESYRLGNIIDLWYFSNITKRQKLINNLHSFDRKNKDSFSIYLTKQNKLKYELGDYDKSKYFNEDFSSYYYDNVIFCVNNFHLNLRGMMEEYNQKHDNILFNQQFEDENHCVIHYRLGDVVTLGDVIDYKDLIQTIRDLEVKLSVIEIMDGGKNHHPVRLNSISTFKKTLFKEDTNSSEVIYNKFYSELKETFPDTKVIQSEKRTTDEDFFRMASAPILITGGGSYALTAAVGGKSRIIRTPSCKTLDFPSQGCRENLDIPKEGCNWKTYQYKML